MRYIYSVLFNFCFYLLAQGQVSQWKSVILEGDEWRYHMPISQPSSTWTSLEFDDASWSSGNSGFGYGDDDDQTVLRSPVICFYIRKSFDVVDLTAIDEALLHLDYDDGFVAYINGVEIARNLVSGNPPSFDQVANGLHEALLYQGETPPSFSFDKSVLIQGENLLAIEIHNESTTSSDMSGIPVVSFGINDDSEDYRETPDWFEAPKGDTKIVSSNLPLVFIDTFNGQEITDEPKVQADMKIVYRVTEERTFSSDIDSPEFVDYNGQIEIEIRGSSSQDLPKKQYGFTTFNDTYLDKENVELLGMPKENDWILNGLAFEPSYLRDYLTYNLARDLGEYASRTAYCEVILNGDYIGLYVLQEKIKADGNRVDINQVEPDENTQPEINGGYIIKADKTTGNDPVAWEMSNSSGWFASFIHHVPNPDDITSAQSSYIESVFRDLGNNASNSSITDGYPSIIDVPSFVDFMILNELASNVDAYQFSTFFHKDRNGKLRAGPLWDINLGYGNDLFDWGFDRSHTDIWQFEDENTGATFWKQLFYNDEFRCYLSKRWNELTQPNQPFHLQNLENRIDEIAMTLQESIARDQDRWEYDRDHADEIASMKTWLEKRIEWISRMIGSFSACSNMEVPNLVISKIHYHPADGDLGEKEREFIELLNNGDSQIDLTGIYFSGTGLVYQFPQNSFIDPKERIILANDVDIFREFYGFEPFDHYSRALSNKAQTLCLVDAFGNLIDIVSYTDAEPWPIEADGEGYFLDLADPLGDNNDPAYWSASPVSSLNSEDYPILSTIKSAPFRVYPNPFVSTLNLELSQSINNIVVKTIDGNPIYQSHGDNSERLVLDQLKSGIYILYIEANTGQYQKKIIKR